jgi:formylglycine-generating enzyme required for sulfatase activity
VKLFGTSHNYRYLAVLFTFFFGSVLCAELAASEDIKKSPIPLASDAEPVRIHSIPNEMKERLLKDMVWVEGGRFDMGSDGKEARERERPKHSVTLDGYYIGRTEVGQALFEQIMGWNYSYHPCTTCPVNNISWLNMQLFIDRLNQVTGKVFRFPTEAEWAYAARGGKYSKGYRFSGSDDVNEVAWYAGNSNRRSHAVAGKNPNELGLYDMTGNLWEFCQDDMSRTAYSRTSAKNPLYIESNNPKRKSMKVIRGSGYEFAANESQVFKRDGATNNVRMPDIGFRLAMSKK